MCTRLCEQARFKKCSTGRPSCQQPWSARPNQTLLVVTKRVLLFFLIYNIFSSKRMNNSFVYIYDWCRFIQGTSAITGQGLYEGLEWLSKTIPNKTERSSSLGSFRSDSSERRLVRGVKY